MQPAADELTPEELTDLLAGFMPEIRGYRVLRRIGRGGMSYVYLGVQESLDRQVAIKVMAPEALQDEISKQRFEHEARTIAKLEHPSIVGIHEVGRTPQGLLFYVLPYLAKGHLGQRDFTQDEGRAIDVLRAILSALEYAHARGIVHRDVKAENVLFDNADRPLLTDFGIALSKRDSTRITTTGLAVGSGGYMAPEQARGEVVDGRADLYSVGVLAYELVAGRLPFLNPDALGLALMHAQDPVPRLPPEKKHWQPFIDRAMAKSADHRYRNAQQMLAALSQVEADRNKSLSPLLKGVPAPIAALGPALRTHWKLVVSVAASLVLLVGLVSIWSHRSTAPAKPDFFTVTDATSTPAPIPQPTQTMAAPPAAPTVAATPEATVEPVAADAAEPVDTTADTATATPVDSAGTGAVISEATLTRLDYDPSQVGARELSAARRQIAALQLSVPPGNNALDSLLAAHTLAPDSTELPGLIDQWFAAAAMRLVTAISEQRDDAARALNDRAGQLARALNRRDSKSWKALRDSLPAPFKARIGAAVKAGDAQALTAAKALAEALEVPRTALQPEWSMAIAKPVPKPGDRLPGAGSSPFIVSQSPTATRTGWAIQAQEVSQSEYATFAAATQRTAARCRNRTVPITLRRRLWNAPGFAQSGNHPVVCVSVNDIEAYAHWLGQRDGARYRLPTASEWRRVADYRGSGDACGDGRLACGGEGTVAANHGPASPLGLRGLHGNVREWLADCVSGCGRHLVAGMGWRDNPQRAAPLNSDDFDATIGYDDIGFRLVRDVRLSDLSR